MDLSIWLIFWYGILHAFAPDHLTAIADFSIGKEKNRTLLITLLFAIGHGISLFIFAKLLQSIDISDTILAYGDIISSLIIISMGLYILFMVVTERINLSTHNHNGDEHIHIWFGKKHSHSDISAKSSSFGLGVLMGIGGVRGMLLTLGAVGSNSVNFEMVGAFTLGVMVIFLAFGVVILYINRNFLGDIRSVRRVFTTVGLVSLVVGTNILIG